MILQELCAFYARMSRDPKSGMPRPGFSSERISFAFSLRSDGSLARVLDLRQGEGSKAKAIQLLVPAAVKRSGNPLPNFLWDNTGFMLGVDGKGKPDLTAKAFAAFRDLHRQAAAENDNPMLQTVCRFLETWSADRFRELPGINPEELLDQNCVFMWDDTGEYIHNQDGVTRPEKKEAGQGSDWCLVTGRKSVPARLHPSIKGVWGGQSAGGSIVSFNKDAFTSYGREQSLNAPVSEQAAAAYTAALNYLLNRDNKRCLQIGDASTVFWAEEEGLGEDLLFELLTGNPLQAEETDASDTAVRPVKKNKGENAVERKTAKRVASLLHAIREGKTIESAIPELKQSVRFFILGLAPNAARIAVRFWMVTTFGELASNTARHYRDTGIEPQFASQPEFPTLWQMLVETAVQGKTENILPPLAARLTESVLTGTPYPQSLLMTVIGRIRADKQITYCRAALIKGCLVRNYHQEVPFMLDAERQDVAYLLGRLFALLEKAQQDALGSSINATIRDRYIGSASSMPGTVFPRLLHLAQHHLAKAEYGSHLDRRISEVADSIGAFPSRLPLPDQGTFYLGYYQQRNALYRKNDSVEAQS